MYSKILEAVRYFNEKYCLLLLDFLDGLSTQRKMAK